ncbi:MAG: asparagine--tRNA ligase [Bacilli bacterium]|nr:asparagine--tRNA ligase [Bacilli bacterium]
MFEFKTVRELYEIVNEGSHVEKEGLDVVELEGWVRTNRFNGSIGFIELNDGTYFKNAQLVYDTKVANFEEVSHINNGDAISIVGKFVLTPEAKQPFEINVNKITMEGKCAADYPLQKKRHTLEYLREIAHVRPRANALYATFRVRSVLSMAIHEFFQSQGFVYVHTPIITSNDAEGAGEEFTVTTRHDDHYDQDFFGKKVGLTVSGQLHVEPFALTYRDVYTFGPTFRAEHSNTPKHAAEFWMIEPEIAFADLEDDMDLMEDMIKYCIGYVLENAPAEMEFFDEFIEKGLIKRLKDLVSKDFAVIDYTEGIKLLQEAQKKGKVFEYNKIEWGMDLQSEHERYLSEEIAKGPVFLTNFPKDIKAFYMKQNPDSKTVAATDLLVPYVGEICGGSQREEDYDKLLARMNELHMNIAGYEWYLDTRRFGGVKHAGFGIGFDRFLMYITGMKNIRDVLPYPRTGKGIQY